MPKSYEVNGTRYDFPDAYSDEQVHGILVKQGVIPAPKGQPWSDQMGLQNSIGRGVMDTAQAISKAPQDLLEGIGAGALSTIKGIRDIGYKVTGNDPPKTFLGSATVTDAPDSLAGKAGKLAEQTAEFVLPAGAVGRAVKAAPLVTRMAAEGATAAAISGAQSGGDTSAITIGAILGSLGPALGKAVRGVYKGANETVDAFLERNPQMRQSLRTAIDYARAHKIPLTAGQASGNEHLITTEQQLASQWGSSRIAQRAGVAQEDALVSEAQKAANRVNPTTAAAPVEAAEDVSRKLVDRINAGKSFVNKRYDQVRSILKNEANTEKRVVGQKASPILDESGKPYMTDVTATFETPVDVTASQAKLRPLYDEISKMMPEGQKQLSPGFTALREVVEGKSVMDAETLDKNLGAIKALIRRQGRDYLPTRSQGIASQIVNALEKDVTDAYGKAGGGALDKLMQARKGVKDYHEVAEILASLPEEPGALYARLTQGGDKRLNLLRDLNQFAPNEVKQIGNTFLQGMVEKLTSGGQIGRAAGVRADFMRLGDGTKKIIFGNPEQVAEFHKFLTTVEELTRMRNPSGTAKAIGSLGSVLNVVKGGKNYALAKILMEPGGPNALRALLVAPEGSAAYNSAVFSVQKLAGPE